MTAPLSRFFLLRLALRSALLLLVLGCAASFSLVRVADAQIIRAPNTWYGRLGAGASVSETDISTYAVEPWSLNAEIGYQGSNRFGLGVGVVHANYPKVIATPVRLTTLHGGFRILLYPTSPLTPYFNVGAQATFGGVRTGAGPYAGLGLDYAVSRRMSVFLDATAHTTFPDSRIDGRDDGRATFDGLGFWGVGVRTTLRAAPTPVDLGPIEGPDRTFRSEPTPFSITPTNAATAPVRYTWHMGDGTRYTGQVVEHTYRLEGAYTVRVEASNDGGRDVQTYTIQVDEPELPARVLALRADTLDLAAYDLVRFDGAYTGTAPIDVTWDFGDGQRPALERGLHAYDADRFIGTARVETSQGYVFTAPGTYPVTLTAENAFGRDTRTVTVRVREGRLMRVDAAPDPCQEWSLPDTLYFAFDQADILPRTRQVLEAQVPTLTACNDRLIRLDGFADFVGPDAYNDRLSLRRAQAIKQFFVARGIAPERFVVQGRGRLTDACPPGDRDRGCRSQRRVESALLRTPAFAEPPRLPVQEIAASDADASGTGAPNTGSARSSGLWTVVVASELSAQAARAQHERFQAALPSEHPLRIIGPPDDAAEARFRVGIGAFSSREEARALRTALTDRLPDDAWLFQIP